MLVKNMNNEKKLKGKRKKLVFVEEGKKKNLVCIILKEFFSYHFKLFRLSFSFILYLQFFINLFEE